VIDRVETHMTVPGRRNYHQAVTRWVLERDPSSTPDVRN
jgi:hypothetical protein